MHYDTLIDQTVNTVVKQIQKDLPAQMSTTLGKPLPDDVIAKLQAMVEVHFRKAVADHRANLRRAMVLIYAEHFTAPELERLTQIEDDPAMIKFRQELPEITAESLPLGRGLVADELPKIKDEAKTIILDYLSANPKRSGT